MTNPKGYDGKIYTPSSNVGLSLETNLLITPIVPEDKDQDLVFSQRADSIMDAIKKFCKTLTSKEMTSLRNRIIAFWENGVSPDYKSLLKSDELDKTIGILDAGIQDQLTSLASVKFLFDGEQHININNFLDLGKISIINLQFVEEKARQFTSYYFLRELLDWFDSPLWQGSESKLALLLVIEESNKFEGEAKKMLIRIAETIRKHGVGVMFICMYVCVCVCVCVLSCMSVCVCVCVCYSV